MELGQSPLSLGWDLLPSQWEILAGPLSDLSGIFGHSYESPQTHLRNGCSLDSWAWHLALAGDPYNCSVFLSWCFSQHSQACAQPRGRKEGGRPLALGGVVLALGSQDLLITYNPVVSPSICILHLLLLYLLAQEDRG